MARKQAADYEQRREAIVEKAAQLFAAVGFQGASIADLAKACESSKSLIYHYYSSKEDILYAVMASHIDQLVEDVEKVTSGNGDPRDDLHRLLRAFMRHYVGAADRQNVLLNELGNLPPDKREVIVGKQRSVIRSVEILLAQIHPKLAADPVQARAQTMLLFGMINWTKTWFDPAGPLSADDVADMAFERATAPLS
ncbi:MAG TPA: TetR/AcrR family transcriptional regulator [Novosphingobium sp.]|nr:TetR/AcrR family transcriptional regulator [Novosphingobium sp.]